MLSGDGLFSGSGLGGSVAMGGNAMFPFALELVFPFALPLLLLLAAPELGWGCGGKDTLPSGGGLRLLLRAKVIGKEGGVRAVGVVRDGSLLGLNGGLARMRFGSGAGTGLPGRLALRTEETESRWVDAVESRRADKLESRCKGGGRAVSGEASCVGGAVGA